MYFLVIPLCTDSINNFPTVLNTDDFTLQQIASQLGVNIGTSELEIDDNLKVIKDLEFARTTLYMANLRKSNEVTQEHNAKLDSFDPDVIQYLFSSSEDDQNELADILDLKIGTGSSNKKKSKVYTGHISVKPKVRGRKGTKKKK